MRIWYLSGSLVPSRTANSVHVMKMCSALARMGHHVALYAWGPAADGDWARYGVRPEFGIRKVPVGRRLPGSGLVRYAAALASDLRRGPRPDLLYARNLPALAASAWSGVPMVLEVHNPLDGRVRRGLFRFVVGRRSFAGLVAISRALADEYLRTFPGLAGRIVVAHDAADPLAPPERGAAGEPLGPEGRLQVGYVGSLHPGKGMEMIAALAEAGTNADFHVVGGSEAQIAEWTARLNAAGRRGGRVVLHGFVPHGELARYFDRCDVFLAPYGRSVRGVGGGKDLVRWMSPLKLFEYMAAGRPIVCSDLPVLREILEDGRNALLVPPGDARAWAAAIERLRGDPLLRRKLGDNARADFLAHHTWSRRAAGILDALGPGASPAGRRG